MGDVDGPRAPVLMQAANRDLTTEIDQPWSGPERRFHAIERLTLAESANVERRVLQPGDLATLFVEREAGQPQSERGIERPTCLGVPREHLAQKAAGRLRRRPPSTQRVAVQPGN